VDLSFNGSDFSHAANFSFDETSCQSVWKEKKNIYIITASAELVTEELKDQALRLIGTSSTRTFQRIQIFKVYQKKKP